MTAAVVDVVAEELLRPAHLEQFIGQARQRKRIAIACEAARDRGDPMDHLLLSGPPGLGKTTLANIVADEMGTRLITTSGPALQNMGDLMGMLTDLAVGDIFFIDEIHQLDPVIGEALYPVMEDFMIEFVYGEGDGAQAVRIPVSPFTLIGATTRRGKLAHPLRERFGFNVHLSLYSVEEMTAIVVRSARVLNLKLGEGAALEIAKRSRGTPRMGNRLLRRVRDFAYVEQVQPIDIGVVQETMELEGIDERGLDELDRAYLLALCVQYAGRAAGVNALAATLQQEESTLVSTVEPYLMHEGFVLRTPSGRRASQLGIDHLMNGS